MPRAAVLPCVVCVLTAGMHAQEPESAAGGTRSTPQRTAETIPDVPDCGQLRWQQIAAGHLRHAGNVECDLPEGVRVFADVIDIFTDGASTRIEAAGNVVFTGPEGHISADRLEYDTETGIGTFQQARGTLWSDGGGASALFAPHTPHVYFRGERLEKLGPRRYRVTNGAWTTCEQPTPRWDMTSGTMVLNLEEYIVARHTVLRVKNVPLLYVPFIYYPIQSDDRATGFLMPTYGTSSFRGQSFSNAFFWAIGRSHDATFVHDVFTRAGQGAGAEYRYVADGLSSGTFRLYRFSRRATESSEEGVVTGLAGHTSYEITGTAVQALARGITARARLDYVSDVVSQVALHQDVYDASRRNRLIEGGITASFGPLSTSALYQRNEIVNGVTDTVVYGSTPRVTAALAPRRLFGSPVYATMNAEYAYLPYRRIADGVTAQDDSVGRADLAPSIRVPLSRLPFLSINTSATYRGTYYTRQAGTAGPTDAEPYFRQYAASRTEVVGPVLTRIWDLGEGGFAERLKHVIEPSVTLDVTSPIGGFRRTPVLSDVSDFVVSGSTLVTYRVTNRLFSRTGTAGGGRGATRELLTIGLQQTRYSRPEASRYDTNYVSAFGAGDGRTFSPVAMTVRVSPSARLDGQARVEYDPGGDGLLALTTGATLDGARHGATLNYSRQRLDRTQPAGSFLSAALRTRLFRDTVAASYELSWDLARSYVVSQRVVGSYMAQCCGVQAEYQQFNFPAGFGLPVSSDRRVNFSFVLAGLGTFSNFFGAFGGL
jgi:LPS-assembly protein